MTLTVTAPLVFVRTSAGTVKLHEGDTIPAEADEDQVQRLRAAGVVAQHKQRRQPSADAPSE